MTHTEFYFAVQNYITIGLLVLLGIGCLIFLFAYIYEILSEKANKRFNEKNNNKKDGEYE